MPAKPIAVGCSCRRIGDRVRDLNDLADRGDREPAEEKVGDREFERVHCRTDFPRRFNQQGRSR
jgi:hypothetical protein